MLEVNKMKRSLALGVAVAITVTMAVGTFAGTANADPRWEHHRWHGWHDRYYRPAPPVVYRAPYYAPYSYYAPPPVVYGPGIGLNFTIR